MKTTKRLAMSLLLVLAILFSMACSACADTGNYRTIKEAYVSKDGSGFTDMGDYLIWLTLVKSAISSVPLVSSQRKK